MPVEGGVKRWAESFSNKRVETQRTQRTQREEKNFGLDNGISKQAASVSVLHSNPFIAVFSLLCPLCSLCPLCFNSDVF